MKISINVGAEVEDIEILISCSKLTPEIEKLIAAIRTLDKRLTVLLNGEIYILDIEKVLYIEVVDRKTFVYTKDQVYETSFKLYELELQLEEYGFFRISKSCIVQLKYIQSLKADCDRKIKATMENGEQIIVSRQYSDAFKKRLGVK